MIISPFFIDYKLLKTYFYDTTKKKIMTNELCIYCGEDLQQNLKFCNNCLKRQAKSSSLSQIRLDYEPIFKKKLVLSQIFMNIPSIVLGVGVGHFSKTQASAYPFSMSFIFNGNLLFEGGLIAINWGILTSLFNKKKVNGSLERKNVRLKVYFLILLGVTHILGAIITRIFTPKQIPFGGILYAVFDDSPKKKLSKYHEF